MRIEQVRASAFGPLRQEELSFAPGMTVVHGPNEAGKSAWFAATYAALAGRRRAKGRGTLAQRDFADRHKPWVGSRWTVGGTFSLANGVVLALEHNLRTGETSIVESVTRRPLTVTRLEQQLGLGLQTDGGFDGARLLGLNRDALRAIAFVAQADVLRVVEDSKELQHLLERASSTVTVDVTADGALDALRQMKSQRVGVEHVGSRPLRVARQRVEAARTAVDQARDRQGEWISLLDQGQRAAADLAAARIALKTSQQSVIWSELRAEGARLRSAENLSKQLGDLDQIEAFDDSQLAEATSALTLYDNRGVTATDNSGESAEQLRAMLADLPDVPAGDLETRPSVQEAHRAALAAEAAVRTHAENAPASPNGRTVQTDPDRLRTLASILEENALESDESLNIELKSLQEDFAEQVRRHEAELAAYADTKRTIEANRSTYEEQLATYRSALADFESSRDRREGAPPQPESVTSHRSNPKDAPRRPLSLLLLALGSLLAIAGIGLGATMGWSVGGLVVAVGVAAAIGGLVLGSKASRPGSHAEPQPVLASTRPTAPIPPEIPNLELPQAPVAPVPSARVSELEVRLQMHHEQRSAALERQVSAIKEIEQLGITPEPAAIREVARILDDDAAASERRAQHQERASALDRRWRDTIEELLRRLREAGQEPPWNLEADDTSVLAGGAATAYEGYVAACRTRAEQAGQAARRVDLESRLRDRLDADTRLAEDAAGIAQIEARVVALSASVAHVAPQPSDHAAAAEILRGWLIRAAEARRRLEDRRELQGRLDQILDGRDLEEWRDDLANREAGVGPDPGIGATEADVTRHREEVSRLGTTVGAIGGQARQISDSFEGLAARIEEEREAERELAQVEALQRCLDLASTELQKAKEDSQRSVAPALEALMRPHLPAVTNGRYVDVEIDPARLGMTVRDAEGRRSNAQLLSHGTTEQLYLLLRLALTEFLAQGHESAPFVLDDITVQSDATRTLGVLNLLHKVSRNRQVIVFTQEDEVIQWANASLKTPQDRIVAIHPK